MGCDGGTIPKRDELVRTKKKEEQKDKQSELNFRWRCCNISQTPLKAPIVACGLGRLYNKDAVITGILEKTIPESSNHIKSMKDVKDLNLTPNPAFSVEEGKSDAYVDHQTSPYICPIIGLEMNGKFKFCFSWSCGCVVSERAMKQLKSKVCHKCQKTIEEEEIVILNASDDDLETMKQRKEVRQMKLKMNKRSKKVASRESIAGSSNCDNKPEKAVPTTQQIGDKSKSGIKRQAVNVGLHIQELKKAKDSCKIADDPNASKVYKSLFTSSETAKNQSKAHWITYNPFYN